MKFYNLLNVDFLCYTLKNTSSKTTLDVISVSSLSPSVINFNLSLEVTLEQNLKQVEIDI